MSLPVTFNPATHTAVPHAEHTALVALAKETSRQLHVRQNFRGSLGRRATDSRRLKLWELQLLWLAKTALGVPAGPEPKRSA